MSLEETLTARDEINSQLRGELDKVTGGWGIRIARVEIKAIEPPASIQESMERQMKADREKRAMILTAEGQRESAIRSAEGNKQSQILTAEGAKQAAILNAEADRQSRILRAQGERAAQYLQAQGEAKAIEKVFAAIKSGRPTPELLAYQYLQTLPQMAQGDANKVWIVPSDFGKALEGFTKMLGAPGGDGVFRFEPSPVDDAPSTRPEDDDEAIKDWFDTSSDPEIARVVADAEAQARAEIPPPFAPSTPAVPAAPRPGELPSRTPDELPTRATAGSGCPPGPTGTRRSGPRRRPSGSVRAQPEWSPIGRRERQSGSGRRPTDRPRVAADRPPRRRWPRSGGAVRPRRAGPTAGTMVRPRPAAAPRAPPRGTPSRESAVPTPPRGVPRVDEDPDTVEHVNPARPGYPSPPRSPRELTASAAGRRTPRSARRRGGRADEGGRALRGGSSRVRRRRAAPRAWRPCATSRRGRGGGPGRRARACGRPPGRCRAPGTARSRRARR